MHCNEGHKVAFKAVCGGFILILLKSTIFCHLRSATLSSSLSHYKGEIHIRQTYIARSSTKLCPENTIRRIILIFTIVIIIVIILDYIFSYLASCAPDLFNNQPSALSQSQSSTASHDLTSASHQPDMLAGSFNSNASTAASGELSGVYNQPPDMLPDAEGTHPADQQEIANQDVASASSGPDILSNGMRADDRIRPDILAPAGEEAVSDEGNLIFT